MATISRSNILVHTSRGEARAAVTTYRTDAGEFMFSNREEAIQRALRRIFRRAAYASGNLVAARGGEVLGTLIGVYAA